jgi:uncharacterized protein (TIGR02996 family)
MTTATADLEAALLADVLRDPSDDTPRMALADVLQERGDPRGEFVAVQLVLDRLRAESGAEMRRKGQHAGRPCRHTWPEKCASCRDLGRRERELFKAGANVWCWFPGGERTIVDLREPPDVVVCCHGPGAPGLTTRQHFHRGLVSEIACTLADFDRHAAALFAAAPVTAVRLTGKQPYHTFAGWWGWGDESDERTVGSPGYLPHHLFELLAEPDVIAPPVGGYHTEARAFAALSAACVAYGRSLAGLPPLPAAV